jgi:hypothetical protein
LVLVVCARLPVTIAPEGIFGWLVVNVLCDRNPPAGQCPEGVVEGWVMALRARYVWLLHGQAVIDGDVAHVAEVAQLVGGLVQRIGYAVANGQYQVNAEEEAD